jgi:AAA family ATP:ADP antiporter
MSLQESGKDPDGISRLAHLLALKREELAPALISATYFFCLLLCYYLLRPVRETFGIRGGYDNLPWLMTGTLVAMAMVSPVFATFASRVPRRVFIPWTYRFFAMNILVFCGLLHWLPASTRTNVGYAFYIWLSVFNLFVVSIFWAVVADVFGPDRGKRALAIAGVGGTVGAIAGSWVARTLSRGVPDQGSWLSWAGPWTKDVLPLDAEWLLLLAIVPLECACQCVRLLRRWFDARRDNRSDGSEGAGARLNETREPTRDPLAGLKLIVGSPFLATIGVFMLLFTTVGTLLYMEQGRIIEAAFPDEKDRRAAFATIDLWSNIITLSTQLFLAGRIMRWIGPRGALLILPTVYIAGFTAMIFSPTYGAMAVFQVARRGLHYAIDRPVRELLFAGLSADARYKAKTFIDTFVYRAGDMVGGWSPLAFKAMGAAVTVVAPVAVGLSVVWLGVAAALGWLWGREQANESPESARPES